MDVRARFLTSAASLALLLAFVAASQRLATAQQATSRVTASAPGAMPRLPDGHPDLQGTYDVATLTPLERPAAFGDQLNMTEQQARQLEGAVAARKERASLPDRGDRPAPPIGGDGSTGAAGNVGGYNNFWVDNGTAYVTVNGQKRTSIIIDPPNGRVPALTAAARQRQASRVVRTTSDEQESGDPGLEGPGAYDDPERRPLGERCLLGFGSTSGPPALPVLYNNLHQIVQNRDTVMILNEMDHDARIIRMNGTHLPPNVRKWMGDSIGRWEGDTLVVETTNFTDKTRFRGSTDQLKVTERFSRLDANTLLYRFTVEDPATWATPWTGEYTWPATGEQVFEYACHEANYALGNILRGARQRERDAKTGANR
ncbi:MAG TPA: hypothetical protein VM032_02430 [Vicinamibacterales bacterium]|nr:hypothetical protein [Vicinamibacterales bacterium]